MTHQIKIYQRDDNKAFRPFEEIAENGAIALSEYKQVYHCKHVSTATDTMAVLEEIYTRFNVNRPPNFKGHSLSVSDIVTLDGNIYFVDSFGFKKIDIIK